MIPDWQLPPGVDRGLWDYLHSGEMVRGYDGQMAASPLARADVEFCERAFPAVGRLLDMGCGTGRLCLHFAAKGYDCVGVDLSEEMLAKARENYRALTDAAPSGGTEWGRGFVQFVKGNLVDLSDLPAARFDYAACLFSTLGMIRGADNRAKMLANAFRLLKPGGRFVLHVHNRWFRGLGLARVAGQFGRSLFGRPSAGDMTMPQAYGGAPLTLHHFTRREALMTLWEAGFRTLDVRPIGIDGKPAIWPTTLRAYGYLILAEKPAQTS
jgi:SAM-dependent methyltransferase